MEGNPDQQARIVAMSTRCLVGTGEAEAIAGTILGDQGQSNLPKPNRRLLMFGKGPTLPVTGKLANPVLDVLTTGDSNDQWHGMARPLREELRDAGLSPGDINDSALWPTFAPGAYSVRLRGANQTAGVGLVEFFEY